MPSRFLILLCLLAVAFRQLPAQPSPPVFPRVQPLSPDAAAKSFRALDGFEMQLLAAEPLVTDPVAMTYDEDGRAFVCEMNDYPYTDKARHRPNQENPADAPLGRVRLLEDVDGDGRFDRSTVFAEGLPWPTGVACWRGGVLVIATPDLWYFKDTDGDGRADVRERLWTGFRKLNVQAVANNLVWGLDNALYLAGGSNGGELTREGVSGAKPLRLARADVRLDPRDNSIELVSGGARFGNAFDDWGNRFLCNIRNPAQHIVLEQRHLGRNPHLPPLNPLHDAAEAGDRLPVFRTSPVEAWRAFRADRWSAERSTLPRSELVAAGVVTSSSGVTVYRGAAYPPEYRGQIFVADVAGNLFYRLELEPDGATFRATRADARADFVTSDDLWFRPVNFVNAPDGTLHVLDMYREVIEHPWSIPDDIHAALDLRSGADRGRLWRLAPKGFQAPRPPRLSQATTVELVVILENPNAWWRETAQRLLLERADKSAERPLREMLNRSASALARLHAMWTLHGLGQLTSDDWNAALRDADAGVRENAVLVALARNARMPLPAEERRRAGDRLISLTNDPSPRVRFQVALALGNYDDPRVSAALASVAAQSPEDAWLRAAVLSSSAETSFQLLNELLAQRGFANGSAGLEWLRQTAQIIGARNRPEELERTLKVIGEGRSRAVQAGVVAGLGDGLKRSRSSLAKLAAAPNSATGKVVSQLLAEARQGALQTSLPLAERLAAVQLLAHDSFNSVEKPLLSLLASTQPPELQLASVRVMGSFADAEVAGHLLSVWRGASPAVRGEMLQAMLARQERVAALLAAVEQGTVPVGQFTAAQRASLLRNRDEALRQRAEKLFGAAAAGSRAEVIARFKPALGLPGERGRGQVLFDRLCVACHRLGERGGDVGPNLAGVQHRGAEDLLVNILDPNREVAPEFAQYEVELRDGRAVSGAIAADTAAGITLRKADGATENIARAEVARVTGSGLSLMPEGLEAGLTAQDLADLIVYLRDQ
jgi:putative membrane-bound dehydrogenase-like protein